MIGVVGADGAADRVATALDRAGLDGSTLAPDAAGADGAAVLVAIGEGAVLDLASTGPEAPVLPVDFGTGLPSVTEAAAPAAAEAYLDGEAGTREHPLLAVEGDGEHAGNALMDVALVRSDPGRISEYSLAGGSASSRFRADGVVVATPAGSHGYARSAGGPRLALGTDAVAVVPIAAFGLGTAAWVLDPAEDLALRVERDEGDVSLLLDGRERRRLAGPSTVTVTADGTFETVVPPD